MIKIFSNDDLTETPSEFQLSIVNDHSCPELIEYIKEFLFDKNGINVYIKLYSGECLGCLPKLLSNIETSKN